MPPSSTPAAPVAPATALTFETPSPSTTRGTRMRTRNLDGANASPEDPTSKGGRSLRKRNRVDYSFDQADEEEQSIEPKATPTTTRSFKKRKTEALSADQDFVEDFEPEEKQQSLELPSKPATRRSIGRRSTMESQPLPTIRSDDDLTVQDTIEVGGHTFPQALNGSSHRRSSDVSHKESALSQPSLSQSSILEPQAPTATATAADTAVNTEEPESKIKTEITQDVPIPKIEVAEVQPVVGQSARASARELSPASNTAASDVRSTSKLVADEVSDDPYDRITPYIDGVNAFYPALQGIAPAPSAEPEVVAEETPQDTPPDDALEDVDDVPDDSTPAGSPTAMEDTAMNSPAPEVGTPDVPVAIPKKQYPYKKLRPAQDLVDFIADYETLPIDELYTRLELLTGVLDTIQQEHNGCRKIIDDEENAIKYQAEEQAFQHRVKLARSKDPNADPLRKDFVVKGIRAPKPDRMTEYARQQDRIMAQAYGFEYDDRDTRIGTQDPIGQRGGIGKGRLRDRPKQTAKAAEAEDPAVVHGKRSRKPPNLFGEFEPASRGSTPAPAAPPPKRRGRQPREDISAAVLPVAVGQTLLEETPKKRGRGGRPRKHPLPTSVPEDALVPEYEPEEDVQDEGRPVRKRKRRNLDEDDLPQNGVGGMSTRRRNSRLGEIPSTSFYSTGSTQANDESRPNTASSTGTVSTATSTYGLREKRQKKFSLDDEDDDFEDEEEQPKTKRIRRLPKKVQEQDCTNIPASNIPDREPTITVSKTPKIRVKTSQPIPAVTNVSPVNSTTGPPGGAMMHGQIMNGDANPSTPEDNKDYGQMTKSEKMSASMKARWASGSMSNAVAKRRATLAAKKEKAATQTPQPEGTPEAGIDQQELVL